MDRRSFCRRAASVGALALAGCGGGPPPANQVIQTYLKTVTIRDGNLFVEVQLTNTGGSKREFSVDIVAQKGEETYRAVRTVTLDEGAKTTVSATFEQVNSISGVQVTASISGTS
ncbi:MAG: hypothetical protein ABEI52_01960 [Halobacteriaceae archaeon]